MIHKSLSSLFIVFAMTANFCLAQNNTSFSTSEYQTQSALEDKVISLDLTKNGYHVSLSEGDHEISLQKGQHLIVNINGDAVAHYELIYGKPDNTPAADNPTPSIYYTLSNPWSREGWYDWCWRIPVLKEEEKLNLKTENALSFHFLASDCGTKKLTINVFDDTGDAWSDSAQTYSFDTVASYTLTVTVK